MKRKCFLGLMTFVMAGLIACSNNNSTDSANELQDDMDSTIQEVISADELEFTDDRDTAEIEFDEYMDEIALPVCMYTPWNDGSDAVPLDSGGNVNSGHYDFTGDGYDDLFRCCTYGSGIVRNTIVVYDPIEQRGYFLNSEYDDKICCFYVEECNDDEFIVSKVDMYDNSSVLGTIKVENDELVFAEE